MTRPAPPALADNLLVRALAGGDLEAGERLFDAHFDELFWLLRMALPTREAAEAAVSRTFVRAAELAGDFRPGPGMSVREWLRSLALEQIPPAALPAAAELPPAAASPEGANTPVLRGRFPGKTIDSAALGSLSDETLGVLVRSLDILPRQALVLGTIQGLPDAEVARTLGVSEPDVRQLQREALEGLRGVLSAHRVEEQRKSAALSTKVPYHLRPLPGPATDGIVVVHGMRAYIAHAPPNNLLAFALHVIDRFLAKLRRRSLEDVLDDDVGGTGKRSKAPNPTPTLRPFKKPKPTAGQRQYRVPNNTAATAGHRSPKGTPSTARLSNPSRAVHNGSGVNTSGGRRW